MSRLEKEDANFVYLRDYLHGNSESYSDWMLDENGKPKYSQAVLEGEHYALYEVTVTYRINKQTGEASNYNFVA